MDGNFTGKQLEYMSAVLQQIQNSEQTLEIKLPEGMPEGDNWPQGQNPGGMGRPDGADRPGGEGRPGGNWNGQGAMGDVSEIFEIQTGGNYFQGVTPVQ